MGAFTKIGFLDGLCEAPHLSDSAFRVAVLLNRYANKSGRCWPSQRRLAKDLNAHTNTVYRALKELQDAGVVQYKNRARHRGERSIMQLRTITKTGDGSKEPPTELVSQPSPNLVSQTITKNGEQNPPIRNPPIEPSQKSSEDAARPLGGANHWVEFVARISSELEKTLTPRRKKHWETVIEDILLAENPPSAAVLEGAIRKAIAQSKSPEHIDYIVNDVKGASNGAANLSGRSTDGEF